jgi:hypothetical protein
MLGQVVALGVGEVVDVAKTWATATPLDVLAAAAVREAMPNPSPASPATATLTRSSLVVIRLIILISLVAATQTGCRSGIYECRLPSEPRAAGDALISA